VKAGEGGEGDFKAKRAVKKNIPQIRSLSLDRSRERNLFSTVSKTARFSPAPPSLVRKDVADQQLTM